MLGARRFREHAGLDAERERSRGEDMVGDTTDLSGVMVVACPNANLAISDFLVPECSTVKESPLLLGCISSMETLRSVGLCRFETSNGDTSASTTFRVENLGQVGRALCGSCLGFAAEENMPIGSFIRGSVRNLRGAMVRNRKWKGVVDTKKR